MDPPHKKLRLSDAAGSRSANASLRGAARFARSLGVDVSHQQLSRSSADHLRGVSTIHGPLITSIALPIAAGGRFSWTVASPLRLLFWLCSISVNFSMLMRRYVHGKVSSVVLWSDEVTSGNVLRPDARNQRLCFYFALLDLPPWWRARDIGWFPIGYMSSEQLKSISGGTSCIFRMILRHMFLGDGSFSACSAIPCAPALGGEIAIRSVFKCLVADEKAIKECLFSKGASGSKPCILCKNICNVAPGRLRDDPWLRHYKVAKPCDFETHDDASIWEMADRLVTARPLLGKGAFSELQQNLGIKWNPDTILFDPDLRGIFNPASGIFYDYMHCYLTSGGIAQIVLNEVLLRLEKAALPLSMLDEFARAVRACSTSEKLPRGFFQQRVNRGDGHMKAFASETIMALFVLDTFCSMSLDKHGIDKPLSDCVHCLAKIVGVLSSGDKAKEAVGELLLNMVQFHDMVISLFGDKFIKIKTHLAYHIPNSIDKIGSNLSCFSCERRVRLVKQAAHNCPNDSNFDRKMIERMLLHFEDALKSDSCTENCLLGTPKDAECLLVHFRCISRDFSRVRASHEMACHVGHVRADDLVEIALDGRKAIASVYLCAEAVSYIQPPSHYFLVDVHARVSEFVWRPSGCLSICEPSQIIGARVGWVESEGGARPLGRN